MEAPMFWSAPVEHEHTAVLNYIKRQRRSDIIWCTVWAVSGLLLLGGGIFAVIDKFDHAFGFFAASVFVFLVAGGCALNNTGRYKLIRNREYEVCRCRVVSREATRTRYSTTRKVTVLIPYEGKQFTYKVTSDTYKNAKKDSIALLVDYSKEHQGKRDIPIDVIIIG